MVYIAILWSQTGNSIAILWSQTGISIAILWSQTGNGIAIFWSQTGNGKQVGGFLAQLFTNFDTVTSMAWHLTSTMRYYNGNQMGVNMAALIMTISSIYGNT